MKLVQFECCICGFESDTYRLGVEALKGRDCPQGWLGGSHNVADVCPTCLQRLVPVAQEAVVKMGQLVASNLFPDDMLIRLVRYLATREPDTEGTRPRKPIKKQRYREPEEKPTVEEEPEVQPEPEPPIDDSAETPEEDQTTEPGTEVL